MFMLSAGAFYTSGTFWAAASVAVALGVGLGAMWATLRASAPRRRRLTYSTNDTPLLQPRLNGGLEVRRNGTPLTDPRLIQIRLTNTSRRDIASASYDQGQPIKINFGQQILELLSVETRPAAAAAPAATVNGTELHIGPGRFGRRESVSFFVLIDGAPTYSRWHPLIDVDLDEEPEVSYSAREMKHTTIRVFLSALVLFALMLNLFAQYK